MDSKLTARDRPFVVEGEAGQPIRLLATHCDDCTAIAFPPQTACSRCGSLSVTDVPVGPKGRLWTFTSQTFRPPSPPYAVDDEGPAFRPYGVGMVELDHGLLVQARLTESDPGQLHIGQAVEAVLQTLLLQGGGQLQTYAFRPLIDGDSQ